jgi:hypothetical protein
MIRRLAALMLVALMLAGNVTGVVCAGWQASASDRMACCMKAGHECSDRLSADQCCAAGELAQHSTVPWSIVLVPGLVLSVAPRPPFVVEHSITELPRSLSDHPQSPPHFRRAVLLI